MAQQYTYIITLQENSFVPWDISRIINESRNLGRLRIHFLMSQSADTNEALRGLIAYVNAFADAGETFEFQTPRRLPDFFKKPRPEKKTCETEATTKDAPDEVIPTFLVDVIHCPPKESYCPPPSKAASAPPLRRATVRAGSPLPPTALEPGKLPQDPLDKFLPDFSAFNAGP